MKSYAPISFPVVQSLWRIRIAIAFLCCFLIGTLVFVVYFFTSQIDKQQAEQSRNTLEVLEATWIDLHQLSIEDYVFWTAAYEAIIKRDENAMYSLIGTAATDSELFGWIILTDFEGNILQAYGPNGDSNPDPEFERRYVHEFASELLGIDLWDRTVTAYVPWHGSLAFVAAAPVTPENLSTGTNEGFPLMFGIWEYTPEFLAETETLAQISDLRIEFSPSSENAI